MFSRDGFHLLLLIAISFTALSCDRSGSDVVLPQTTFGSSTIRGEVRFNGTPPKMPVIANVQCHPGAPELHEETVVVNPNGTLANVLIYIDGIPASDGSARSAETLDQVHCRYTPRVIGLQVRQKLSVRSSDPTLHNVHMDSRTNSPVNFGMRKAGEERTLTFTKSEIIRVKCDVHPWMTAYLGVFDHPFFAVTKEEGTFSIDRLPPGTYRVIAWHELYGRRSQTVTVTENSSTDVTFTFEAPAR